jgi:hypothetical protein
MLGQASTDALNRAESSYGEAAGRQRASDEVPAGSIEAGVAESAATGG